MTHAFGEKDVFVSLEGDDGWSGRLPEPNADRTDGPKATLMGAAEQVRRDREAARLVGPVTVWIRGGRYFLDSPVELKPEHSGPVTYESYPGEEAILDGGSRIEGWKEATLGDAKVWAADVRRLLDRRGRFRQLFVNGRRASPSRMPKEGFFWIEHVDGLDPDHYSGGLPHASGQDRFRSAPGDFRSWKNLTDLEFVVMHYWVTTRIPVVSFEPETREVRLAHRSRMALVDAGSGKFAKYFVENVIEALSEPGEWVLDRVEGKLYYVPREGEAITDAEAFASHTKHLLKLTGDPDAGRLVEHVTFRRLAFQHADWVEPMNSGQAETAVPGTVVFEGARCCGIEDCRFERLGCYAVELRDGCTSNRIVGNTMADLGAGGVKVNGADHKGPRARRTGNNRITDNHIHHAGLVFYSACGVTTMHSFGNEISHNHIHDLFYSGISCGWVWGYGENVSRENRIEKNHIHDLGKGLLSDMGGVYTLGVQPGTRIRGNLIHDIEKATYGGWAVYPDEGSSHLVIEDNVCYNTSSQPFHQHYGRENLVRNNVFAFGREGLVRISRGGRHDAGYGHCGRNNLNSATFIGNILVADGTPFFVAMAGRESTIAGRDFQSDLNLFWDVSGQEPLSGDCAGDDARRDNLEPPLSLDDWRRLGFDLNSIVADPKCGNPKSGDFTLADDSPALGLGFRPIDLSDVGPRPREKRAAE